MRKVMAGTYLEPLEERIMRHLFTCRKERGSVPAAIGIHPDEFFGMSRRMAVHIKGGGPEPMHFDMATAYGCTSIFVDDTCPDNSFTEEIDE